MTVTKPQAQMLATLAAAARPHGARRWDTAGTMAAIEKVADRNLADVCLATIRAAADRDCETPGAIPTNGPHWREQLKPQPFTPRSVDPAHRCSVCSEHHDRCRAIWADDHEFLSAVDARRAANGLSPEARSAAIAAIKDAIEPTEERPMPKTLDDLAERDEKLKARVDAVRAQLPTPPTREPGGDSGEEVAGS